MSPVESMGASPHNPNESWQAGILVVGRGEEYRTYALLQLAGKRMMMLLCCHSTNKCLGGGNNANTLSRVTDMVQGLHQNAHLMDLYKGKFWRKRMFFKNT